MKYLFCIGAQKAGTTYLYNLLQQHDALCFTRFKELHYFSEKAEYMKGMEGFLKKFNPCSETEYLADFSPVYITKKDSLDRIRDMFGNDARIIIILRNPVERAFSHYRMKLSKRNVKRTFNETIVSEMEGEKRLQSILGRGLYSEQLENVYNAFNKDNILILRFEDLTGDTDDVLLKIFNFLDVDNKKISKEVERYTNPGLRVKGVYRLYYKIPFTVRRKIYNMFPEFAKILRKKFLSAKRQKLDSIEMDDESKTKLLEYYKESNRVLWEEYNIDVRNWS